MGREGLTQPHQHKNGDVSHMPLFCLFYSLIGIYLFKVNFEHVFPDWGGPSDLSLNFYQILQISFALSKIWVAPANAKKIQTYVSKA